MRVLVIGGSAFVGRAIVHDAASRGHEVTVLNRGKTATDIPDSVERLVGDRERDMSALSGREFDATVDVIAYRESAVDALADVLGDRGGHHLQISSISAYAEPIAMHATEAELRLHPPGSCDPEAAIDVDTYGPLKADAERAAERRFGRDLTIVRPTYVIGGHDLTLRFPYWVARCQRGGRIAVPASDDAVLQYIDARDLGAFCVGLLEHETTGAFHACGPYPEESFLTAIRRVASHVAPQGTELVEVASGSPASLHSETTFPLWGGPAAEPAMAMDPGKAIAAGLALRPIEDSVDDVVEWWGHRDWPDHWLGADDEAALLGSA